MSCTSHSNGLVNVTPGVVDPGAASDPCHHGGLQGVRSVIFGPVDDPVAGFRENKRSRGVQG